MLVPPREWRLSCVMRRSGQTCPSVLAFPSGMDRKARPLGHTAIQPYSDSTAQLFVLTAPKIPRHPHATGLAGGGKNDVDSRFGAAANGETLRKGVHVVTRQFMYGIALPQLSISTARVAVPVQVQCIEINENTDTSYLPETLKDVMALEDFQASARRLLGTVAKLRS